MGRTYAYDCPACGYYAGVVGGRDWGFFAIKMTVECRDCRQVFDVTAEQRSGEILKDDGLIRGRLSGARCPVSEDHDVVRWNRSLPCPRCGEKMRKGDQVELWD